MGVPLTHVPWEPIRSPGRGAPDRPIRAPRGSTCRPRLRFEDSFGLRFGLGIKARGQELVHRQFRQTPAGHDSQPAWRDPAPLPQERGAARGEPLWTKRPARRLNRSSDRHLPLAAPRRRHDRQPAACVPLPAPECLALAALPSDWPRPCPVAPGQAALRFSDRGSGGIQAGGHVRIVLAEGGAGAPRVARGMRVLS